MANRLNGRGEHRCAYLDVEAGQAARGNLGPAMEAVLAQLAMRSRGLSGDDFVDGVWVDVLKRIGPASALTEVLVRWSATDSKPLVLLIDEIDTLIADSLISVLRQLRSGYDLRPARFPQSVILCGVGDVRDYRIYSSADKAFVTGGTALNIKAKSLRLGDFTEAEVRALLAQHTAETGQVVR